MVARGGARRGASAAEPAPPLEGDAGSRRRDRRRRLHGAVDRARAQGARSGAATWSCSRPRSAAAGPSGRNGGFLHGYWSHLPRLRERFGDEGALAVARAGERIVRGGARVLRAPRGGRRGCARAGCCACPPRRRRIARSTSEVEAAQELGVPEEAVPLSARRWPAGSARRVFRRGVFMRDGATIQPARLALALRRARSAGAPCTSTRG